MAKTNDEMQNKIQTQQAAVPAVKAFEHHVQSWWKGNQKRITDLLGSPEHANKLLLTAMNVVSKDSKLLECSFETFGLCLLNSAELNLFPGALQECAYVPFYNSKTKQREAQFIPMYQGLVKLAYNTGLVDSISTSVVYEADEFDFIKGTKEEIIHRPFLGSYADRGERKCVYCVIGLKSGGFTMRVFPMEFMENIRKRSPGAKYKSGVWFSEHEDDFDAMCCKTALRHTLKLIPKDSKLAKAIDVDEKSEMPELDKPKMFELNVVPGDATVEREVEPEQQNASDNGSTHSGASRASEPTEPSQVASVRSTSVPPPQGSSVATPKA